jgi:hypothetical protein
MQVSDKPAAVPSVPSTDAEAARYALLRRLAPSMRHHLVVNLQPIGMIYEVMDRRLRAPVPDMTQVHESAQKINGFARAALNSCIDVVGWLAPDETVGTTLQEAVRECAGLLATSLSFRGYALRNEVGALPHEVRRSSLRCLLTGALIHKTDHLKPPAELLLSAEAADDAAVLSLRVKVTQGDKGFTSEPAYRKLEWSDLKALAVAEDVELSEEGDTIRMRFPWVVAA